MASHRSAPGSPSKASELDFMIWGKIENRMDGQTGEEHDIQSHMLGSHWGHGKVQQTNSSERWSERASDGVSDRTIERAME